MIFVCGKCRSTLQVDTHRIDEVLAEHLRRDCRSRACGPQRTTDGDRPAPAPQRPDER